MIVSIIAAIGENRELGKRGAEKLLWNVPEDMAHFKRTTQGAVVIMGSSTYESIGRALPGRYNIVLSQDKNYIAEGCNVAHSLRDAIDIAKTHDKTGEVFIIGGASIYEQALDNNLVDRLHITQIPNSYPSADVFLPDWTKYGFNKIVKREVLNTQGQNLEFLIIEK